MACRLFTVLSALSLLLCAAVVVMWVRSYRVGDALVYTSVGPASEHMHAVTAIRGTLLYEHRSRPRRPGPLPAAGPSGLGYGRADRSFLRSFRLPPPNTVPGRLGFAEWRTTARNGVSFHYTAVPIWLLAVLLAALPLGRIAWRPTLRARRRRAGRCWDCGYDLTANVSGACPECGRTVPSVAAA